MYNFKFFAGTAGSQLDQRIRCVRKSYLKQLRHIDKQYPERPGICCRGCAYGYEYSDALNKANRIKTDLIRLLQERMRNDKAEIDNMIP
jgi:hypothetical protein